ncbi:MAG: patatin-like phospholipase family protein, partial [Muribaculaceae bacterium]|nr:patatin-like phospholipase family protein [Muribaculaceae bacterium]
MRAMRASKCFILSLFLLLTIPSVSSSETMVRRGNQSPQSVGLVLSGGGAKGIAHIGVIQALEDNDIPIDYITGTSMGAIVGGLYACGYTPAEMMELLRSEYFMSMSTGTYDPELTYYFSRPAESPQMFSISLGTDSTKTDKRFDPQSLIAPTPMAFGFMELFSSYTAQCNADFDNLFVPY